MTNISAPRENNRVPALIGTSSTDGVTPTTVYVDPTTHRLLVNSAGGVTAAQIAAHFITDEIQSTNNQTIFPTTQTIVQIEYVSINGSIQSPTSYTVGTNSVTLSSGIPANNDVLINYIY